MDSQTFINETGPFDIIGDIHGCSNELLNLLDKLDGDRKLVFLGDYVDRGPNSPEVLEIVRELEMIGRAICVQGNHDNKLMRFLMGRDVKRAHGLDKTINDIETSYPDRKEVYRFFLENKTHPHFVLDNGRLVVAHAGLEEALHGKDNGTSKSFALYGKTTGEADEYGLPVRLPWENDYQGKAVVVYGHTPQAEVRIVNNTYNIDTGCAFGNKLTALRYPEMEIVQVPALQQYAEPKKPLAGSA